MAKGIKELKKTVECSTKRKTRNSNNSSSTYDLSVNDPQKKSKTTTTGSPSSNESHPTNDLDDSIIKDTQLTFENATSEEVPIATCHITVAAHKKSTIAKSNDKCSPSMSPTKPSPSANPKMTSSLKDPCSNNDSISIKSSSSDEVKSIENRSDIDDIETIDNGLKTIRKKYDKSVNNIKTKFVSKNNCAKKDADFCEFVFTRSSPTKATKVENGLTTTLPTTSPKPTDKVKCAFCNAVVCHEIRYGKYCEREYKRFILSRVSDKVTRHEIYDLFQTTHSQIFKWDLFRCFGDTGDHEDIVALPECMMNASFLKCWKHYTKSHH